MAKLRFAVLVAIEAALFTVLALVFTSHQVPMFCTKVGVTCDVQVVFVGIGAATTSYWFYVAMFAIAVVVSYLFLRWSRSW